VQDRDRHTRPGDGEQHAEVGQAGGAQPLQHAGLAARHHRRRDRDVDAHRERQDQLQGDDGPPRPIVARIEREREERTDAIGRNSDETAAVRLRTSSFTSAPARASTRLAGVCRTGRVRHRRGHAPTSSSRTAW
jgi:hypothetical protein